MQVAVPKQKAIDYQELLIQIASGSKAAESALIDQFYRGLFFVINRQSKDATLAEDIVQDTFVIVLQKARRNEIQNPLGLAAFIRQTGINLLIGHYRKETRRDTHSVDDIDTHTANSDLDISKLIYSKQALAITQQLMNELKVERDKDLLRNFFIYDKSKAEICAELDLKPEHFDRVMFRARQRLKQIMQHKLGNGTGKDRQLLSITLLIGLLSGHCYHTDIFEKAVRESSTHPHLPFETPKTNSRYILTSDAINNAFTPTSRYV